MGIRREEEMEMSDDDMEDAPDGKDLEDLGMYAHFFNTSVSVTAHKLLSIS